MKRLALVAVVLVLAACTAKKDDAATDTSAPAMAPAPAAIDTGIVDTTATTTPTR
jgi:protein involved in sex pheromone biosynthesis